MENFEELLEMYSNDEEIEKKKMLDFEEDKKDFYKNKTKHHFENTITIREFVNDYLGTEHECNNLKHKGLKSFKNPYVIGIPNDFAVKNPDCISRNEILVVLDTYGNPGAYLNPDLVKNLEKMEEYKYVLAFLKKVRITNLENLQQLYDQFTKTVEKIDELEEIYKDGIDLLTMLERENILKKIRNYIINNFDNREAYLEKELDIQNSLIIEQDLFKQISLEKEDDYDKYKRK